jgi:hypothetical protein
MARNSASHESVGARAVGGRGGRRRLGWLWGLLALLALLLLVGLLIALLGGDDDGGGDAGKRGASTGALTVGGQPLTPDGIRGQVGQDASGRNVVVQQVIEGEGFFVGTSRQDSVYVEYGGAAGKAEDGYRPERAGERVTLDGPVRPAPADPAQTLKLPQAEAARVEQQGAYVNANSVRPAGQ